MSAAADGIDDPEEGWDQLAGAAFVSVGTFRRSGKIVTTPVWIAADGRRLVLTSERRTGKVRRLRNDTRIVMQVCDRFGRIPADAARVAGTGRLVEDADESRRALRRLRAKYGFQFTVVLSIERLVRRLQRRDGDRIIIAIEPAVDGAR